MKTVFIKSGTYYETPAAYVGHAINEINKTSIYHFLRGDNPLAVNLVNDELRIFQHHENPLTSSNYNVVDCEKICDLVDKYGHVYLGVAVGSAENIGFNHLINRLSYYTDNADGYLVDVIRNEIKEEKLMFSVAYAFKMADPDVYVIYLTGFARTSNYLTNDDEPTIKISDELQIVCVNDGSAIRDQFIDVDFTNVRKHFKNSDLIVGHSVFAEKNKTVEVSIFKDRKGLNTEEFRKCFSIEVDSCFDAIIDGDKVIFETGDVSKVGYLSIKVIATPIYNEVVSAEIKETLNFDFTVSIY